MERHWVQSGGIAGMLSFVLTAVSLLIGGGATTPESDANVAEIRNYLVQQRQGTLVADVLLIAVAALILWYGGTLSRLLHERDPRSPLGMTALAATAVMAVFLVCDGLSVTVLAFLAHQDGGLTDASTVRALYDLYNGIVMPGAFGFMAAIFLAAVGLAMVRRVFAARWLGYLSLRMPTERHEPVSTR